MTKSATPTSSSTPTPAATLLGAALTPVVKAPTSTRASLLTSVRLAAQPGFDRFVLQFDGPIPGFAVRYVGRPVRADPSNMIVSVKGSAALQIVLRPASGTDLTSPTAKRMYVGPTRIRSDTGAVQEAVQTGDFENVLTWVLGVDVRRPFVVRTLSSPSRVIVDVSSVSG